MKGGVHRYERHCFSFHGTFLLIWILSLDKFTGINKSDLSLKKGPNFTLKAQWNVLRKSVSQSHDFRITRQISKAICCCCCCISIPLFHFELFNLKIAILLGYSFTGEGKNLINCRGMVYEWKQFAKVGTSNFKNLCQSFFFANLCQVSLLEFQRRGSLHFARCLSRGIPPTSIARNLPPDCFQSNSFPSIRISNLVCQGH